MKKAVYGVLGLVGVMALPFVSLAATYQYVDVNGNLKSIEADDAAEALIMPDDMAPTSGVIRVTEQTEIPEYIDVEV